MSWQRRGPGAAGVAGGRRVFFFSSRRRHTRYWRDWSSDCALPISPGHTLTWADGTVELRRFARPGPRPERPELGEEAVREVLRDSVRAHLVSDVPVGVLLSEIGRASCRERVSISVVAVSLIKRRKL